jgi:putative ABC transport system ATP-binding protein
MGLLHTKFGKTIVMVTHDPHAAECAQIKRRLDKGLLAPEEPARA